MPSTKTFCAIVSSLAHPFESVCRVQSARFDRTDEHTVDTIPCLVAHVESRRVWRTQEAAVAVAEKRRRATTTQNHCHGCNSDEATVVQEVAVVLLLRD